MAEKSLPPGWTRDENGKAVPPSIGPATSSGKGKGEKAKTAVEQNRTALADSDDVNALAAEFGLDLNSLVAAEGMPGGEDPLEAALTEAALEVSGVDLFNYGDDTPLPSWVPASIREYARLNPSPLKGVYDPYQGFLAETGDERVFMGREVYKTREIDPDNVPEVGHESKLYGDAYTEPKGKRVKKKRDDTLTFQQAVNLPYTWEEDEVTDAMKRMRKAGLNVRTFDELTQVWGGLVDRASKTYSLSLGEKKVTPWDVLELHRREQKNAGSLVDYENGSQTRVATSVTEISEGASWSVLRTTLSNLLGRDPSDQELRDYTYRMNTLAAKNPSISETVTRYKGGEAVSSETSTTGGFDADDMAQAAYEGAQDDPEYAKVQAGTTYYNTLLQAIGAVGEV